jgi:O-antigen/teichoic acid export membrane protein
MDAGIEVGGSASAPIDPLDRPDAGAKVIRGGAIRGLAYAANILLVAATVPLMTRHLGVANFGRFVTASSVVMIVAGITEFGLSGIGTREYAISGEVSRRRLVGNLIVLRTLLTLAGLAIAYALMSLGGYPSVVLEGMLIAGVGLLLINTQQTLALTLTASLRWGLYAGFELVNTLVVAGGTVVLVLVGAGLLPFFYIGAISSLAALVATIAVLRGHVLVRPRFDVGDWARMIRDALPYAAAATVGILYFRVALIVISLDSSTSQTGYYSTAFKVVEVVSGTAFLMSSSAFPIFARAGRDDHERLRYGMTRVGETALIAGVYLAFSLVVAAPFVIKILAGPSFKPAVSVLQIQAITLIATFLGATWSFVLLSLHRHLQLLLANALALVVAILLSLLLVPQLGAEGGAIATAATEFVLVAAYWGFLTLANRRLRPPLSLAPKVLLAVGAATLVVVVLPLPSIVVWAIGSIVYAGLLLVLKAVPPELVVLLQRRSGPPDVSRPGAQPPSADR